MIIAGVDEAGRGPWAGPVVAAAVVLPAGGAPEGVTDSKRLSAARRAVLAEAVRGCSLVGVGQASVAEIDALNIYWATMLAMERAVAALGLSPDEVLVDGNRLPKWRWRARAIVKGDLLVPAIGAASIIAKTVRDEIMAGLAAECAGYGWERNQGYGTAEHARALASLGVSAHHRRSFAPVRARMACV